MFLVVLVIIGLSLLPNTLCTNSVALHYTDTVNWKCVLAFRALGNIV